MPYRARLPAEFDLADLTHGERELARWAALPFGRKLNVVRYLVLRLWRRASRAAWRQTRAAAIAGAYALSSSLTHLAMGLADLVRSPRRGAAWLGSDLVLIAAALGLVLLAGGFKSERRPPRPSIVEQARAVRDYYPPRCYYEADGDVVVMDSTWRVIRPNDRRRDRLLRQFCD